MITLARHALEIDGDQPNGLRLAGSMAVLPVQGTATASLDDVEPTSTVVTASSPIDRIDRLAAYSTLTGIFTLAFGGFLAVSRRRRAGLAERVDTRDIVLVGVASHKLSRIVTGDKVASPIRAPFTTNAGTPLPGGVKPRPRGEGLRRAIGELVTCPFCTGVWIAAGMTYGLGLAPRATRWFASIFASVAVADFLQRTYAIVEHVQDRTRTEDARTRVIESASLG